MARVSGEGVKKKGRKRSPSPLFPFFGSRFISRAAKTENLVSRSFFAPKQHGNACYAGCYLARRVAYKSISILSRARSANGRLFMFSAVKANERARAFALGPGGGGALPYITYTGMCRPTGS